MKRYIKWIGSGTFLLLVSVFLATFLLSDNDQLPKRRYIFIDGGAHRGESIEHFAKSKLYSQHPWEIFAFEANPNLIRYLPKKANLTVLNKAIWIHNEGVNFYLGEDSVSSSILGHKKTGNLSKVPIKVESVDFGQWLRRNFSLEDYILVKFDIEGAEYEILNKMLIDGTIEYIDELYVEFHNIKVDIPEERDKELVASIQKFGIPVKTSGVTGEEGDWFEK